MSVMDGQTAYGMATEEEQTKAKDYGNGLTRRDEMMAKEHKKQRSYFKEATATIDISGVQNGGAEDIIRAIKGKIGVEKILAVRPKTNKQYEVTFETEEDCDVLLNGLEIKGQSCDVKKLQDREYVVSFMHLPVYLDDEAIMIKLKGWGVTPTSGIRRRFYPGTEIEDGTRFLKVKFPKEVASLPYSSKFETAEGLQFFRIMHSRQVKTCRLCISPEHILKDCPEFKCFKCDEQGHFARDCTAAKCPECGKPLNNCDCWIHGDEEERPQMDGQVHDDATTVKKMVKKMEKIQQEFIENVQHQRKEHQSHQDGEGERMEDTTERDEQEITEETEICEKEGSNEMEKLDMEQQTARKEIESVENQQWRHQSNQDGEKVEMEEDTTEREKQEISDNEGNNEMEKLDMEQRTLRKGREKSGMTARRMSMKVKPNLNVIRKKKVTELDKRKLGMVQELEHEED